MFEDLQNLWAAVVFIFTSIGGVFVWLRGLLRQRPPLAEFRRRGNSFWRSIWAKLAFIKTKLLAGFLMIGSALIAIHDFLLPVFVSVDWQPLTSLLPSWALPLLWFAIGALFYWLRWLTAQETNQIVAAVQEGATPQEAVMMVATNDAPMLKAEQRVT